MKRLLVPLAVVASLVGAGAVPAGADTVESFHLPANTTVEKDYPTIVASEPASGAGVFTFTPSGCAGLPSCHLVPFTIEVPPGLEEADDFVATIEVAWDAPTGAEDLDIRIYDDGQIQTGQGEDPPGDTQVGESAGSDNPEVVRLFNPKLGNYQMTVGNFSGGPIAWRLKATSTTFDFQTPFESLDPETGQPTTTTTTEPDDGPTTTTTAPAFGAPTTSTTAVPSLDGATVAPDVDFTSGEFGTLDDFDAGLEDADALAEQLAAAEALANLESGGDPPSAVTLLFWLLFVPLALVGLAVAIVARRNPAALAGIARRQSAGQAT